MSWLLHRKCQEPCIFVAFQAKPSQKYRNPKNRNVFSFLSMAWLLRCWNFMLEIILWALARCHGEGAWARTMAYPCWTWLGFSVATTSTPNSHGIRMRGLQQHWCFYVFHDHNTKTWWEVMKKQWLWQLAGPKCNDMHMRNRRRLWPTCKIAGDWNHNHNKNMKFKKSLAFRPPGSRFIILFHAKTWIPPTT